MDEITKVECYFSGKDYIANIIVIIVIVSFLEKKTGSVPVERSFRGLRN